MKHMDSVFISHSWHDKRLARKIAETLRSIGGKVWLDEAEIKLGDSLIEKIREGIDSVDYVIALLSKNSVSSPWVTKELDIAMNQEIGGKTVKVLPVLASKCDLPGFLEGKLYADMSSNKAFRQSLPMLLNRLGITPALLDDIRSGKSAADLSRAAWVSKLSEALSSADEGQRYHALKEVPRYDAEKILGDSRALELVFQMTEQSQPVHIRILALRLIGGIKDSNFAYRIEHLLEDENPYVLAAAIEALADLKAVGCVGRILPFLTNPNKSELRMLGLSFFSQVEISEDYQIISLISTCQKIRREAPDDEGLEFAVFKAIARQIGYRAMDLTVTFISEGLKSFKEPICLHLLERLIDSSEDIWITNPKHRISLFETIIKCTNHDNPEIVAKSWLAIIFLSAHLSDFYDREMMWNDILSSDMLCIDAWLQELENYRLKAVFDDPSDTNYLIKLFNISDGRIRNSIADILCEIGNEEALRFLSRSNYKPSGWKIVALLRSVVQINQWVPELTGLLNMATEELPQHREGVGKAFILFVKFKAQQIDLSSLINEFPTNFSDSFYGEDMDQRLILSELDALKNRANSAQKKRLGTLKRLVRTANRTT
jgi:hypothetical protein